MFDVEDKNKALRITAVVTEWNGNREIEIESVDAPLYEHKRIRIVTDVGEVFEVSAWDMIRAIKACAGVSYSDDVC